MAIQTVTENATAAIDAALQEAETLEVELVQVGIGGLPADEQEAINQVKINLKQAALWLSQINK